MHNFLFWLCERKMESLLHSTSATYLVPKFPKLITYNQNSCLAFARNSVIVGAKRSNKKKNNNDNNKEDSHSFFSKADEDNLFFPEAVLLKEVLSLFVAFAFLVSIILMGFIVYCYIYDFFNKVLIFMEFVSSCL